MNDVSSVISLMDVKKVDNKKSTSISSIIALCTKFMTTHAYISLIGLKNNHSSFRVHVLLSCWKG